MCHEAVLGRAESSSIFVHKSGRIYSMSVKDVAAVSLGKKKESACLTYHTKTLGSNTSVKTENYLRFITISVPFLLKMWEHNTA